MYYIFIPLIKKDELQSLRKNGMRRAFLRQNAYLVHFVMNIKYGFFMLSSDFNHFDRLNNSMMQQWTEYELNGAY